MKKTFPKSFGFMPRQSGYGSNGIPDHVYCVPVKITEKMVGKTFGIFIGIEAKTVTGKQSALQRIAQLDIEAASGEYRLVYGSEDIPIALSTLKDDYADNPR